MRDFLRRHRNQLVFAATAFFHLFYIPYFDDKPRTRNNLGNPNEVVRVYAVRAMSEGHLYLNRVYEDWPERTVDCAGRPRQSSDGADAPAFLYYPGKSPGPMLFVVPFYYAHAKLRALFGGKVGKFEAVYVCRLFGSILPSILLSYCIYLLLGGLSKREHLVLAIYLVYLLGTLAYPNALLFVSHQLASTALFVAFGIFVARRRDLFFAAGFLVGLAIASEYSAALAAIAIGVYALVFARGRHLLLAIAGGAIPIAATLWYNAAAFGSPFKTAYDFLVDPQFSTNMATGWHGFIAPRWTAFFGSFFSASNGLFFFSPILLLGLYGAGVALRRGRWRAEAMVALSVLAVFVLYISCFIPWRGGWSVGPRYIANVVPFLAALALVGLDHLAGRFPTLARGLLGALGLASISLITPTSVTFPHLPDSLRNPFDEWIVPMLAKGYVNRNLLGLPAWLAYGLFVAVLLAVVFYLLFGDEEASWRSRLVTAAASVAFVVMFHLGLYLSLGVSAEARQWALTSAHDLFLLPPLF